MTVWSQIQGICGFLFKEFTGIPPETAQIIFDRIGTKEQIEILDAIFATFQDENERASGERLMRQVEAISVRRNKIVHSGWGLYNGEVARFWHGLTSAHFDEIMRETPKGKSQRERFIFTLTDLNRLTGHGNDVANMLEGFLHVALQKRHERRSSPSGHRPPFPPAQGPQRRG